jgi:hypothetical protein
MWGALSDKRTGLSFTITAAPRHRCHSWVRIPWNSGPYFIVSDSRLSLFVASYDSQGDSLKLDITRVTLYSLRTDHAQKTGFYCCVRNITPRTSHLTPSQYCWSVTSCACVEVCLPSHNLEKDCVTSLFRCQYVHYLETANSVAQLSLHGANTPQYMQHLGSRQ